MSAIDDLEDIDSMPDIVPHVRTVEPLPEHLLPAKSMTTAHVDAVIRGAWKDKLPHDDSLDATSCVIDRGKPTFGDIMNEVHYLKGLSADLRKLNEELNSELRYRLRGTRQVDEIVYNITVDGYHKITRGTDRVKETLMAKLTHALINKGYINEGYRLDVKFSSEDSTSTMTTTLYLKCDVYKL